MNLTLNAGRELVAIPGPSVVPDRVLSAMHRAMPNIYGGELIDVSNEVFERLPAIARTTGRPFVAIANGHGVWEMAISNTLSRGDQVLVLESGPFAWPGVRWRPSPGVKTEVLPAPERGPVDPAAVESRLRADVERDIAAVLVAHVDTGTSARSDIEAIRAAIDNADHPALLMVDSIASLGCDRYEMDAWGVDVTIGASQKGLMVPPGLGLVWAGPRAMRAHATAGSADGILGLDRPGPGRAALPALLRHTAHRPPVRAAGGAGHDRGGGRTRGGVGSPCRAGRCGADGGRSVGQRRTGWSST